MIINDEIIIDYLKNPASDKYNNHWIFYNIEPNQYLYQKPSEHQVSEVEDIYKSIKKYISTFKPMNEELFQLLFPKYKELLEDTEVILVVGCPEPYDAMFMDHENKEYMVFDLISLTNYVKHGLNIENIIKGLITHEFVHKCINEKYPFHNNLTYIEQLNYVTFNEGFAHLLAYKENIKEYDFNSPFYEDKYKAARLKLINAVKEENKNTQEELLMEADAGTYWEKFAAIGGKLYLAQNKEYLLEIYNHGWKDIIANILRDL